VEWLAASSLITAAGGTAGMLLRRNLDFRALNIAGVVSYGVAFFGIGIPMAWAGFAVYALIAAFLAQALIQSLICYRAARHPVAPLFRYDGARGIVGFGLTVFVTNLVNWVMSSLDRAIIGALMGVTATGLYATMQNLITVPAQSAVGMLQPVFYSASAKVQSNPNQLRQSFRGMMAGAALFVTPVFVAVGAVAKTFILALYGTKWAGGDVVLTPLALAIPAFFLMNMSTPVLWTSGYPRREFQVQLPMAFVWAVACYLAARYGTLAIVGWSVWAIYMLRAAVIVGITSACVGLPVRELPALFAPGVLVSALVAVAAITADHIGGALGAGPQFQLALIVVACGAALVLGLRLVLPLLPDELKQLLLTLADRLPRGTMRRAVGQVLGV